MARLVLGLFMAANALLPRPAAVAVEGAPLVEPSELVQGGAVVVAEGTTDETEEAQGLDVEAGYRSEALGTVVVAGATGAVVESLPAAMAVPLLLLVAPGTTPLLADPLLADPLLADPLLADPLLAGSTLAEPVVVESAVPPEAPDVPALIVSAALRYGVEPEMMLRVAWCESRWDPAAQGPAGAAGVFQFVPQTWAWASAGAGYAGVSPYDPVANVEAAAWLMAKEGPFHWGCR